MDRDESANQVNPKHALKKIHCETLRGSKKLDWVTAFRRVVCDPRFWFEPC